MSWEKVRLGDVVEFNPKIKLEKDLMYECIEMEHIKSGFKFAYPGKIKIGNSSGSKFQNGDTLFARITPCLENGKIAEAKGLTNDVGIGSTEFFVLRNIQNKTDKKFVFYLALTDLIRGTAEKSMQGASGRQRAIKETVENLYLKLPPLPTQKRIADILSTYDNLIENNLQRIKH
ncbi:MAG TPA: restriction endonuclease subunit S, partial [Chitinophagaceae bacterium]|nr:restriction endonuclease subunit S [Chitinophagaceae bacterium]